MPRRSAYPTPAEPLPGVPADPMQLAQASRTARTSALRIVLGYLLLASTWILLSDRALALLVADPQARTTLGIVKGWGFVAATAVLLYHLIERHTRRVRAAEEALRAREEQMLQAQHLEALGTLAGGVAHDFNNTLTVIGAYTDLLREGLDAGDARRADLGEIRRATEHGAALTRQLLAFSRRQMLRPVVVDMCGVVRDTHGMLGPLLGSAIQLALELPDSPVMVRADAAQLRQVLVNLVVNARDAMPAGGMVTIALRTDGAAPAGGAGAGREGWAVLDVRDGGTGMDAATLARAFEPFFTTKPQGQGTGLGLATVYGIVTQSGGRVAAESRPALGTTVRVLLPLLPAGARATPPNGVAAGAGAPRALPGAQRDAVQLSTRL